MRANEGLLYLFRHGSISSAFSGTLTGRSDPPLSARGEAEALFWREELRAVPFCSAFTSPLARARKSAFIILSENAGKIREPVPVPDLREISLGLWDGRSKEWIKSRYPGEWAVRGKDIANIAPPGGESFRDLAGRALPAFRALLERAAFPALLVAHQAVNRVILSAILGLPLANALEIPQPPATLNIIEVRGSEARLAERRFVPQSL